MKINQIKGLNRQARKFLLNNLISVKGAEVMALYFKGHVNGYYAIGISLIRENGIWVIFSTREPIQSIYGDIDCFITTENTFYSSK
jgi:hypothetical protein